jgi:hypothetical protein
MSVEFFRFVRGAETWRYSTLAETITAGEQTWLPAPIRRADVDISTDTDKSGVSLSTIRDLAPISLYAATTPRLPTYVTIYRADASSLSTFAAFWHGQIASVQWQGSTAEIRCEPVLALMRRTSPRQRYSVSCRWTLYDSGCGVNRNATANFRTGEIIDTDSTTRIKIATVQAVNDPENWARGGTIEVTSIPGTPPETVTLSEATVVVGGFRERWIELARPLEDYGFGETIRLQRGCGHTLTDCTLFGNAPRYGGFPLLPTELAP